MIWHLHHVHIFASELDRSVQFYKQFFGGEVVLNVELAGARNVFMKIGNGRLHFYNQSAKNPGRGSIHHFGIQTDDIEKTVRRMRAEGIAFTKGIKDFGFWRYIMVPAPDDILVELFEVDEERIPAEMRSYFNF